MFREFLLLKYNLHTSIHGDNRLYIKAKSKQTFTDLIEPYILECVKYKLHSPCKIG